MKTFYERWNALFSEKDEFLKFSKIENKHSTRPDLHALILLDKLMGNTDQCILSANAHDTVYLNINIDKLNEVITDEQIIELNRSGILLEFEEESLYVFV